MKKLFTMALLALVSLGSFAQLERSEEFHQKYKLKSVAIFSRHNCRAPITDGTSALGQMTTHQWIDWTAGNSELTMKGGILETAGGEFFQQWTVREGLFGTNAMPDSTEVLIYANNKQRTIATARYFLSGFLPLSDLQVKWNGDMKTADPHFNGSFYNITQEMQDELQKEIAAKFPDGGLKAVSQSADEGLKLIDQVLDYKNSQYYAENPGKHFADNPDHDWKMFFVEGNEPDTEGSIKDAASAADALTMQYYQSEYGDSIAAYFGNSLTMEQRRAIFRIKDLENGLRWQIPCIYKPLSQNILSYISAELKNDKRKFYFMCGHDSNIFTILSGLELKDYDYPRPYAVEQHVPIGSKIVFEKWEDTDGRQYIAVNHVYQTIDQVRGISVLTASNPPVIIPLQLSRVTANEDGLYPFDDFISFIDNINTPVSISDVTEAPKASASATYNVMGQRITDKASATIIIRDGKKYLNKKQ